MTESEKFKGPASAFESPTFGQNGSFDLDKPVGSASISPCGRDVVLASRQGLHIIDLDSPYSPPRHLPHHTPWEVADVQWSPFAARDYWVVSTSNQKALVWNLTAPTKSSVEHVLHAHTRAITDINFSAHNPDVLATCAVDSFVHCWDLRQPTRPAMTFCDWFAAATQVKWNRQDPHVLASSHDKYLRIWDDRKGAYPLRSIEAHATKIYGIDWDRTETPCLVTCSLDRTIKFWDYTRDLDKPGRVLHAPFPVWRARHTPFGSGLLAMPQRGDHDLHLYDCRTSEDENENQHQVASAVYRFGGHHDQVKEFLWRPRGTITETHDERDFQLVSWGTDRILRLHQVDDDVLSCVGYDKGMRIKRCMNFTRRNAVYKTFREDPANKIHYNQDDGSRSSEAQDRDSNIQIRSALTAGMSRAAVPFVGGYGKGGFMSPVVDRQSTAASSMDPISWMRGVKIGKRGTPPSDLHQSVSSVLSPSLKTDPTWDVFDSLGEEITHVGEKFTKVSFDEVDMQRRKIIVSLTGPWGLDRSPTYIKARIEFPSSYPDAMAPLVLLDRTVAIDDEIVDKVFIEIAEITAKFLSRQRSSLEVILRYLLGEQNLQESLFWLKKRQESVDLDSMVVNDFSSSDEDDEVLGKYSVPKPDDTESSDSMMVRSRAQNNPPLPKACGALWADNGLLVCFFPPKPGKEPSPLELSLRAGERSSKGRKSIFEGFGRFDNASRRKRQATSTLETIESGGSSYEESSVSSSDSSSASDDIGLSRHHFLPNVAWRGDTSEAFPGGTLDESQRSSSGIEKSRSLSSNEKNFISIQDHSNLLPAREYLAHNYVLRQGSQACLHNAGVAQNIGDMDLANVWLFVDLILQHKVPLETMMHSPNFDNGRNVDTPNRDPVMIMAQRAVAKPRDSAIDLPLDGIETGTPSAMRASVKWGHHPFAGRYLVNELLRHYERMADVQMLAMLSFTLNEIRDPWNASRIDVAQSDFVHSPGSDGTHLKHVNRIPVYYQSGRIARANLCESGSTMLTKAEHQDINHERHSSDSFIGVPFCDMSRSTTPPSNYRPLRTISERRESLATSLSSSPEQLRHANRSSPNLSALQGSAAWPLTFNSTVASSPPMQDFRKRLSPTGSNLGVATSTSSWSPSQFFGRSSSTITEDPKSSFTISASDTEEDAPSEAKKPAFMISLKNQDQFHKDGYSEVALLDPEKEWRYLAYREAYAHLLYVWDLPITRNEMLKHDGVLKSDNALSNRERTSQPGIGMAGLTSTTSSSEAQCLEFEDHCKGCNILLTSRSPKRRCEDCSTAKTSLICLLCNTYIQGLFSPCLGCGHVLHSSCRQLLQSYSPDDVPAECISGCGCTCANHAIVDAKALDQVARTKHEDVSPAVTVIGDGGTKEQEQLGWYDNSEWEEMAYESLARNLRPRPEVKRKRSQVWKRSTGST